MTEASDAYAEAQYQIEKAHRMGTKKLELGSVRTRALTSLPPEIAKLDRLTWLDLRTTQITDLSHVTKLTALNALNLSGTPVTDLRPLAELPALTWLELIGSEITEFDQIAQLTALTSLDLSNTYITNFAPISGLTNLTWISFGGTQVVDLAPLARLTKLATLDVRNTLVSDLSTLTELTALTTLRLDGTKVTDPRPLATLTNLATNPRFDGLTFNNTPFAALPEFAGIAEIADPAERAKKLFAALEGWVPAVPQDSRLAPDYTVPDNGPIRSSDDPPQGEDPDQEDLRHDLIRKSAFLVAAIGNSNEMAVLKGAAEHYQRQIDKPLARIRINLLFSAANSLRVAYEADLRADHLGNLSDLLPPRVSAPLKDLVETHALFFMGFPNAAEVQQTMLAGLTGARNPQQVALAEPIVTSLQGKVLVLDPEDQQALADDLAGAKGQGASAEIAERRLFARLGNIFGAIGRKVYREMKDNAKPTAIVLIQYDIIAFVLNQQTFIGAFLKSMQGAGAAWFDVVAKFLMRL